MKLGNLSSCSFATELRLICGICDEKKESSRKEITYLTKTLASMKMDAKKDNASRRKVQLKRDNLQRVCDKNTIPKCNSRQIRSVLLKKYVVESDFIPMVSKWVQLLTLR